MSALVSIAFTATLAAGKALAMALLVEDSADGVTPNTYQTITAQQAALSAVALSAAIRKKTSKGTPAPHSERSRLRTSRGSQINRWPRSSVVLIGNIAKRQRRADRVEGGLRDGDTDHRYASLIC